MDNIKLGRIIGVLLLIEVAMGILLNFVFTAPLFGEPGFLINAAPHAVQIGQSVLIGIAMGLVSLAVACILYPIFKQQSQPLALFYFALACAGFALTVAENISMMSMLSLSKAYVETAGTQEALYQGLRSVVKDALPQPDCFWRYIICFLLGTATRRTHTTRLGIYWFAGRVCTTDCCVHAGTGRRSRFSFDCTLGHLANCAGLVADC